MRAEKKANAPPALFLAARARRRLPRLRGAKLFLPPGKSEGVERREGAPT